MPVDGNAKIRKQFGAGDIWDANVKVGSHILAILENLDAVLDAH